MGEEGFRVQGSRFWVHGSGLAREAARPLIMDESFVRIRNEKWWWRLRRKYICCSEAATTSLKAGMSG